MKYSLILFIASLMLMARFALGQVPYFETRNMDEDIPGVIAKKVIQTGNGNLLVGTNQGLVTYDGHEFKLLTWGDSSRAEISSLFQSNSGEIWAGGHNGVIYHVKHDSIIEFFFEEGHPGVAVTAFAESSDSLMWFGTYGEGIYYWDGRRQFNINMDDGLPDNYVYDIITDRKGNCWAGTDRGLVRCRLVDGKKEVKGFGLENGLSDLIIISLAEGEDGKIWYGTYEHGIGNIDPLSLEISTPTIMSGWNYGAAETLLSYGDQLLIGTGRNGIIRYDIKNKSLQGWTQTQRELTFNRISDLLLDDQMNIWAASYGQLVRSPGHALEFTVTKPGSAESPGAILQDKNGNIFIAYGNELWFHKYEKGVFGKAARVNLNRKVNSIISLYEDERKRIWIGSFGEGIIIYDPKNEQERYIDESQGLRNGNILSIDGYGQHVWLATLGGAEHILLNEDEGNNTFSYSVKHLGEEEGLANNFIYKVFADSRDRVWFGTDGNGISVIEKGVVSNIFPDTEMADLVVYSITEDQKGNIWFSTARNGIYCLGDTVWHLEPGQGLKGSDIRGLAADNSGRLLILHNEGITIYDILKGHYTTTSNVFTSKSSSINLNALSVREGIANIGTGEGFISINTSFLPENITPPTIINRVSVFLSPQSLEGGISLKHNKNYLSFHYSGLWFAEPEKVSYEVMLGGHDMEWVPTTDRSVTYANLPPGDYVFRVRSSIDGIFDKTSESSYSLSIRKPFWTTYWFLSLLTLTLVGTAIMIIRWRENNLKRIKDLEKEKLLFEFETLKSQVNPHFLFNSFSTLTSLIEDNADMAVDYVQKLSNFFRKILENRDRELIPLKEELELINNYTEIQQKRFGEALKLNIDIPEDKKQIQIPPLVLQLLIENAIKHNIISSVKPLQIDIFIQDPDRIIIKNKLQPKIDRPESTGLGLVNIRQRYALLTKKQITVNISEEYFIVELPLIQ